MTARQRILIDQARESAARAAHLTEGQSALTGRENATTGAYVSPRGSLRLGARPVSAHLYERPERNVEAEDEWRSSAEERDAWWHTDWGVGGDW